MAPSSGLTHRTRAADSDSDSSTSFHSSESSSSSSSSRHLPPSSSSPSPSPSPSPSLSPSVVDDSDSSTWLDVFLTLVILTLMALSISYITTQTLHFGLMKVSPRTFTLEELSTFDGSDPDKPIYISVKGHVYDVSAGKQYYSKGHGYNIFAGRDCTRAFVTGCFKEKYPGHDLRGLTQEQIKDVDNWLKFYQDHAQYFYVGELILPELGPNDPLPNPDCTAYDEPGITPVPDNNANAQAAATTDTAEATDAYTVDAARAAAEAPIPLQNNVDAPTPAAV